MSTRFYAGQTDYIVQLNLMDDQFISQVNSSTVNVTNDNATNATVFPVWASTTGVATGLKASSAKMSFNPSTGLFTLVGDMTVVGAGRFDKIGIGAAAGVQINFRNIASITGNSSSYATYCDGQIKSDVTATGTYFFTFANTEAAVFTLPNLLHYHASQGTFGAGSSVGAQVGFRANSTLIGADNNYGFQGLVPAGATNWNLYMQGTAKNYIAGNLLLGSNTDNGTDKLQVTGTVLCDGLASDSGSIGYAPGAGGAVLQATSKSTAVTLSKTTGQITLANTILNASTTVSFTLTNTTITANDVVYVQRISGGTAGVYQVWCDSTTAGSAVICVRNTGGTNLTEQPVLQFVVVRGSAS